MSNTSAIKLYTLDYSQFKTYIITALFIIGNVVFPQLVHLMPKGGLMWLPIYFFTLVGAYKYGWKVGLLTAVASPIINSLLFGMPSQHVLPAIMFKSVILALSAGIAANYFKKASLWILIIVVMSYQVIGILGEWVITENFFVAIQDLRIGIPGILVQIFGGWGIINFLIRK